MKLFVAGRTDIETSLCQPKNDLNLMHWIRLDGRIFGVLHFKHANSLK